ncbi:LOW QUALITY PROTEIN: hypothetical protein Cgig2_026649 [Carnegiea gigantea]|uniref:Protein FAR1-RELATED SEQUENCE n=1 Tax=Carnegiea gigantea TaxID=171969 RepID=A0A9Q1K486_9CARY|nr:LOW QUALITY PROTEIN: hypothetical protein Cgig2_026649 [Carnegiea gigantea]
MSGECSMMMENYNCSNNHWLYNLYSLHEKWYPTFSKYYFTSGVLSSQRSETMNRSLQRRLRTITDLCDFYNIFCDVVSKSKENGEDHRCSKGNVEMAFPSISILKHAMSVYTVEAFLMFEKEFIDGAAYNYKAVERSSYALSFKGIRDARESHREESYEFRHIITFNKDEGVVECTYKMFIEVGILCSHYLRVLHACCIKQVPDEYIIRRWCKDIKDGQNLELGTPTSKEHAGCSSIWKMQMSRNMNSIIIASQMNKKARAHCEKYFMKLKKPIEFEVGSIHCDEDGQGKVLNSLPNALNPPGSRQKGITNKRFKSIIEKKCDQVKRRKSKKLSKTDVGSSTAPPQNGPCSASAPPYTDISYSQMLQQITLPTFNHSSSVPHVQHLVSEFSWTSHQVLLVEVGLPAILACAAPNLLQPSMLSNANQAL